ncbi:MAG TPA: hypothetical protein VNN13_08460, partial [Methylomirabilota bacterium]|nr:hypothetical protein [Methylomirabilota bacterium]
MSKPVGFPRLTMRAGPASHFRKSCPQKNRTNRLRSHGMGVAPLTHSAGRQHDAQKGGENNEEDQSGYRYRGG